MFSLPLRDKGRDGREAISRIIVKWGLRVSLHLPLTMVGLQQAPGCAGSPPQGCLMLSIFTASKCKALLIWNHKQKVVEKTLHIWEPHPRLHGAPCITCSMLHPIYNKVSANTPPRDPLSYVILGNVPAISSLAFKGMGETITWTGGLNLEFMIWEMYFFTELPSGLIHSIISLVSNLCAPLSPSTKCYKLNHIIAHLLMKLQEF